MIYTNDEADKAQRKKDFLLRVWVLPFLTGLIMFGLLYVSGHRHLLQPANVKTGYWMIPAIMLIVFGVSRNKWLKMPDGTYYHTSAIAVGSKKFAMEPTTYEEEFFYSGTKKIAPIFLGLVIIVSGIYFLISRKLFLYALLGLGFGIFSIYKGITGLLDKSAQLKIGNDGLWTKKLGFVPWTEIQEAKVVLDKKGEEEQLHLEIWMRDTAYAQAGKPDELLNLSDIKNGQYVEMVINNFSRPAGEKNL